MRANEITRTSIEPRDLPCVLRKTIAALFLVGVVPYHEVFAQEAGTNPVLSAEDAFGFSDGLESSGIYSPGNIRGFNPQAAGNARIDGLYFDQQGSLSNRVIQSSTIRVGLSEIGYAFPAPTGIVDYELRRATGKLSGTVVAQVGPFERRSFSLDGNVPLSSGAALLPMGVSIAIAAGDTGYTSNTVNLGAAPQWTPNDRVTVRGFADWTDTTQARTMPVVFTEGSYLPPRIPRAFLGQDWALGHYISENFGGLVDARLSQHWTLAAGVFRSVSIVPQAYTDVFVNTSRAGFGDHVMVGQQNQRTTSSSGEEHLTGQFSQGAWGQEVTVTAWGRDTASNYGGSDSIDLGRTYVGAPPQVSEPHFDYGPLGRAHTSLWSTGVAYKIQRTGWGVLAVGAQNEHYEETAVTPGVPQTFLRDSPIRWHEEMAVPLPGRAEFYSGYTQGFEDSGAAPSTATNRGDTLPTTRTWQMEGGVRYPLNPKLGLIAGLFELNKPYFNFDVNNVDRQLGAQHASGFELSIAGQLATGLNINAGALIGQVHIVGPLLAAQGVGSAAVGQPRDQEQLNVVYALPRLWRLSVDLGLSHVSSMPGTVDDAVYVPELTLLSIGERYQFEMLGVPATLRVEVQNALNAHTWVVQNSPGFFQQSPRTLFGYLTVDL